MIRSLICAFALAGSGAFADVPDRLEAAVRNWAAEMDVQTVQMAIWRDDRPVRNLALNGDADAQVELASLSKAVTALCAAALIRDGIWTAETTSRAVLGIGPDGIDVAQLMTHSAGLAPDETQTSMQLWLDTRGDKMGQAAQTALMRVPQQAQAGRYHYSNENYAVLGAMIAAQTGMAYATYCRRHVLDPAGVTTARVSPRTGSFAAFGGWQMSVEDYARLMHWGYGAQGLVGMLPEHGPQAEMGGGAYYGVGMVHRDFRGSRNYWHFGALCFPGRLNAGSFAVRWMSEWSVVVAYEACVDWDAMARLDGALSRAVFQ